MGNNSLSNDSDSITYHDSDPRSRLSDAANHQSNRGYQDGLKTCRLAALF